jgi:hypothetical protein
MTIYILYVNLTNLNFFKYNDNQIRKRLIIIYSQAMRAICIIFLSVISFEKITTNIKQHFSEICINERKSVVDYGYAC